MHVIPNAFKGDPRRTPSSFGHSKIPLKGLMPTNATGRRKPKMSVTKPPPRNPSSVFFGESFGSSLVFPKKKPKKGNRKEPDLYAALDEKGNVIDLRIIGGTFSLDVDPDTGINWLVG